MQSYERYSLFSFKCTMSKHQWPLLSIYLVSLPPRSLPLWQVLFPFMGEMFLISSKVLIIVDYYFVLSLGKAGDIRGSCGEKSFPVGYKNLRIEALVKVIYFGKQAFLMKIFLVVFQNGYFSLSYSRTKRLSVTANISPRASTSLNY